MVDLKKIESDEQDLLELAEVAGKRVIAFLESNLIKVIKGTNAEQLASSANLLKDIQKRGMGVAIAGTQDVYERAIKQVESSLPKKIKFTKINAAQLEQLIEFRNQGLTKFLSSEIEQVRNAIASSVLLGTTPDYTAIAANMQPRLERYVKTELTTETAAFHRSASIIAAKQAGLEKFLYYGNIQDNTRAFCRQHVGNIYTLKELQNMDNGQDLPVIPYLGGYNCRHRLVVVE